MNKSVSGTQDVPENPAEHKKDMSQEKVASPHDRKAKRNLILVLIAFVLSVVASFYKDGLYIMGYIVVIVYSTHGIGRRKRSLAEIGIKRDFGKDMRKVWYYSVVDAVVFQVLPPMILVAFAFGYGAEVLQEIKTRVSAVYSLADPNSIATFLAIALVLTLLEEFVFRVTIQERLSWFIGTPAAIAIASLLFCSVHAVGASGNPLVILTDIVGVAIDGIFFGVIYAKTHNLAVTWMTHYVADIVGLLALLFIL
jgi:membrane protease YdiL (CAAX protease family)